MNNLKQLGIALHNYNSAFGTFPTGQYVTPSPGTPCRPGFGWDGVCLDHIPHVTFMVLIYAYLEEDNTFDQMDFSAPTSYLAWRPEVVEKVVPTFRCPSDGIGAIPYSASLNTPGGHHLFYTKGNYHGVFSGDTMADVGMDIVGKISRYYKPKRRAVFGVNRWTSIKHITDGTSKTMLMSEYIDGGEDLRGFYWEASAGAGAILTQHPPNTSIPDILIGWTEDWCPEGANQPENNRPCVKGGGPGAAFLKNTSAARSMHPGGVHALLADGSVHFVEELIDLATWQRLAGMQDGLVFEDF